VYLVIEKKKFINPRLSKGLLKPSATGVPVTLTRSDIVLKLSNDILREAKEAGANAIVISCPLCQANLDGRQRQIEETYKTRYVIPIIYITQLMGLAFGAFPKEVGIQKVITSPREAFGSAGLMWSPYGLKPVAPPHAS